MVEIKPFKAWVYNQKKINDLSKVVCPPYDVISPQQQEFYHKINPYNFIHILLRKDIPGEDKYQKAKELFNKWIKQAVLVKDKKPCFYLYLQEYNLDKKKRRRIGFVGLLRIKENDPSVIGHEHTRIKPKEDRLNLLRATQANLSPIFTVFVDKERLITRIYSRIKKKPPFIKLLDYEGILHKLWRIDNPEIIKKLIDYFSTKKVFIADGHHRYEVACLYKKEMEEKFGNLEEADFNYLLTYFTDCHSEGLVILPIHRIVKLDFNLEEILKRLSRYFLIKEIKDRKKFLSSLNKRKNKTPIFGMYKDKRFWILKLKSVKILYRLIRDKPKAYILLDVVVLNTLVLKKVLRIDAKEEEKIIFVNKTEELFSEVDRHKEYLGFLLPPLNIDSMLKVINLDLKMPAKSTYFYPKVLSGLLIHKFNL